MSASTYSAANTGISSAKLGGNFGYRFDGDIVTLSAEIDTINPQTANCDWRLQLWACPDPYQGGHIRGIKVADVELNDIATAPLHIETTAFASIPAGTQYHSMVMVLATQESAQFATIHDFANYPMTQSFLSPRMTGTVGYRFDESTVHIDVEGVDNPRDNSNISGSLSLELWALKDRYEGGAFEGTELAGVAIGTLQGQECYQQLSFDLPLNRGVNGEQHVVLMLREWTANGYITRDFSCFAIPVSFGNNTSESQQKQHPAKSAASRVAKTLVAAIESSTTAKKTRSKSASTVNEQSNAEQAAQSVQAKDAISTNDVIRSRGRGRKVLAKVAAVTAAATKKKSKSDSATKN
jgi:hypothetical protein